MKFVFLYAVTALALSAQAQVHHYKIDPAHTAVIFKVSHLGFSHTYGQFPKVEGTFSVDEAKPEATLIEIKIKSDSVSTYDAKRDKHLKGADFFNAKQNPDIAFKSKSVKKAGEIYQVTGDLTMNGVTKSISFDFKRGRTGQDPWGGTRTGGDASFKVKRSDFNMKYMNGENQVGDEVEIFLSVEGIRA